MYPNCLKDLVGLVHTPTNCLEGTQISNVSTLDLFVTQDPAYDSCRLKGGDSECELIALMNEMCEEALKKVTVDVGAMLTSKVKLKQDVQYFIGQPEYGSNYSSNLVPAQPYLDIRTDYRPGAFIKIDKIALMISPTNGPINVALKLYRVYSDTDLELLHTFNIEVTRRSTTPQGVIAYTIPCDGGVYRLTYDFDAETMVVPDSNYHCGCGDKLKVARGFILENVSKSYGIAAYVTMFCQSGQVICSLLNDDNYRLVIGHMIRKMTITLLISKLYWRQDVNRFTLLTPEDMQNKILTYEQEYAGRLQWLSEQRDFHTDGFCLTCDTGYGGRKYNMLTGR